MGQARGERRSPDQGVASDVVFGNEQGGSETRGNSSEQVALFV